MEFKNINELAEILNKNGLTSLEFCDGETKIKIEKAPIQAGNHVPVITPVTVNANSETPMGNDIKTVDFNNIIEIKSPLVGVFYHSAAPDAPPFVTLGSKVKKGDVLCIVEAMKLMNEITAETDGEIVDICIKNGDIAEFGQILFKMY